MKKGFTLVELIACIGIMAMLATIIITVTVKKINETKEKSKDILIKSIELAAENYVSENVDSLNNLKEYDWDNISLQTLVEANKLSSNLLDQTTKKFLPLTDIVYITRSYNGKITASYDINQNNNNTITLNGNYNIYLSKNDTYEEPGATVYSKEGEIIYPTIIVSNSNVNYSRKGNYTITYQVEDKVIERNIIVLEDKYSSLTIEYADGTVNTDQSGPYEVGSLIELEIPQKSDSTFIGWEKKTGNSSISGNIIKIGSMPTTIKAKFATNYTIIYNCNGGSGNTASSSHTYGVSSTLTKSGCHKFSTIPYLFKGWGLSSDSTTATYLDEQTINGDLLEGDLELYAVYTPILSIIGNYTFTDESNGNWRVKIKGATDSTSGTATITFNEDISVDVFLVSGGNTGGEGNNNIDCSGGKGGDGGARKTFTTTIETGTYYVTVGESDMPSSAFGYNSITGIVSKGGKGASLYSNDQIRSVAEAGENGGLAFGTSEFDSTYYGAGGGGGVCRNSEFVYCYYHGLYKADGGETGGGNGCGESAEANTGSGGGGACTEGLPYTQGAGGSGIIIIRNSRG